MKLCGTKPETSSEFFSSEVSCPRENVPRIYLFTNACYSHVETERFDLPIRESQLLINLLFPSLKMHHSLKECESKKKLAKFFEENFKNIIINTKNNCKSQVIKIWIYRTLLSNMV